MGLGIDACGCSVCGNSYSEYEPRFSLSVPADYSKNNARGVILKFDTYSFSSWIETADCVVSISEDEGLTYLPVYDGTTFVAPYNGAASKVRRPDSQRLRFYIQNTALWPLRTRILVRLTVYDDFGDAATKVVPVKWS